MKRTYSIIAAVLALLLTFCCLTACGGKTAEGDASASQSAVEASSAESADGKQSEPKQTRSNPTEAFQVNQTGAAFAMGTWNDGDDLEYVFNSNGSGTYKQISKKQNESFRYEIDAKKASVTFYMGEKERKETASYTMPDDTHLVLKYSDKKTVSLTFGVLITKESAPFAMGTWISDTKQIEYVFRLDGSGLVRNTKSGTELAFQYEVNPSTSLIIFHMGSAEDESAAVYMHPDDTHLNIIFDSGEAVYLEQSGKEKTDKTN